MSQCERQSSEPELSLIGEIIEERRSLVVSSDFTNGKLAGVSECNGDVTSTGFAHQSDLCSLSCI
jgi:hypothetical protein